MWLLDEEVGPLSLGQEPGAASQRQFLEIGTPILLILKDYWAKMVCSRNLAEYYLADITLSKFGGLRLTPNFFRRIYGGGQKFGGYSGLGVYTVTDGFRYFPLGLGLVLVLVMVILMINALS